MNQLDINLMLALNFDGPPWLDAIMVFTSGIPSWIPLYLLILVFIYYLHGWKYMLFAMVFIAAGVGICDQICNFFKATVDYPRPTHTDLLPQLSNVVRKGGLMGTVSGHASTTFSIFLLSSLMVNKKWFTGVMLFWCLSVAYSRIYLGLHFPFQILFGIILGALVGTGLWQLFKYLDKKYRWDNPPVFHKSEREC